MCRVTRPDVLRDLSDASAESADEFSRLACLTIRLDLEGMGVRPAYEDHVGGSKKAQALNPCIFPSYRAQAGPTVQADARIRPLEFRRFREQGKWLGSMCHSLPLGLQSLRVPGENLIRKLRKCETGNPRLRKTQFL